LPLSGSRLDDQLTRHQTSPYALYFNRLARLLSAVRSFVVGHKLLYRLTVESRQL